MNGSQASELAITGVGITTAIGQGRAAFGDALLAGRHAFGVMQRPGRQRETNFLGAEIGSLRNPSRLTPRILRTASFSAHVALVTLDEAWTDARLADVDGERIGLIVGGSNVQQRDLVLTHESYADRLPFVRPTYGVSFLDTDICGRCAEVFGIRGRRYTVGGASASGQLAILQAIDAIRAGHCDVCVAIGALTDVSYWECQALRSLGAMGSDRYATEPALACRPFDRCRDGFIFGECCGVVVIETADHAARRHVEPYAAISGWADVMDPTSQPDPSFDGEVAAIARALRHAGWDAADVDYINPHGTGSIAGDDIELRAIRACGLAHASINATKALVGHGLSAAGTVEVIATLVQMERSVLHPTRNLDAPIDPELAWVGACAEPRAVNRALTISLGFGGINTAICLSNRRAGGVGEA